MFSIRQLRKILFLTDKKKPHALTEEFRYANTIHYETECQAIKRKRKEKKCITFTFASKDEKYFTKLLSRPPSADSKFVATRKCRKKTNTFLSFPYMASDWLFWGSEMLGSVTGSLDYSSRSRLNLVG